MRKGTIVYDLILEMEKKIFSYRDIQLFMANHPKNKVKLKNGKVSRGYACCNIALLVNSKTIKMKKDIGYWADPGTHLKKRAYSGKVDFRIRYSINETDEIKPGHPEINKIMSKNPEVYL